MCGICFICGHSLSSEELQQLVEPDWEFLRHRGPDAVGKEFVSLNDEVHGLVGGCVLWLQGASPQHQPLIDQQGNILLWNGDILSGYRIPVEISDTRYISSQLADKCEEEIIYFLSCIKGPWSFMYFKKDTKRLYFGRDIFGRHSLLWQLPSLSQQVFVLSSVSQQREGIEEVPAFGIYYVDFSATNIVEGFMVHLIPWSSVEEKNLLSLPSFVRCEEQKINSCIKAPLNMSLPSETIIEDLKSLLNSPEDKLESLYLTMRDSVERVIDVLRTSIQRRVDKCPCKCQDCTASEDKCDHSRVAVLFSGGLDSAMIALLVDSCLQQDESIDLLNVAFEQKIPQNTKVRKKHKEKELMDDPVAAPVNFEVPDRISGRRCWQELQLLKPNRRWNFVEIDVTREEVCEVRASIVRHLIHPLASVLDDSIGCALWFAARGRGSILGVSYVSPARVVLCGVGADEQLGGYSRHRGRFQAGGWPALLQEMQAEMARIHTRNLGRDNRILAHHGRAPRLPYLDEDVVSALNLLPVWVKANLYLERGLGEKLVLRVAAAHLHLPSAAALPKRAIQFGSRIAKMEDHKEKGGDVCTRLAQFDAQKNL